LEVGIVLGREFLTLGGEVTYTYSNLHKYNPIELLLVYGYVIDNNPFASVNVKVDWALKTFSAN
jgi:hypothetical protein